MMELVAQIGQGAPYPARAMMNGTNLSTLAAFRESSCSQSLPSSRGQVNPLAKLRKSDHGCIEERAKWFIKLAAMLTPTLERAFTWKSSLGARINKERRKGCLFPENAELHGISLPNLVSSKFFLY